MHTSLSATTTAVASSYCMTVSNIIKSIACSDAYCIYNKRYDVQNEHNAGNKYPAIQQSVYPQCRKGWLKLEIHENMVDQARALTCEATKLHQIKDVIYILSSPATVEKVSPCEQPSG